MGQPPSTGVRCMTTDRRAEDATALRQRITSGDVLPREIVEAAVARCEATDGHINAVIHPRYEAALDDPVDLTGPLGGVPILVKDLGCEQAGEPHHHGAVFLRDLQWQGTTDSYLWRSLRDSGAVCLGRTNTPEFGSTITTEPVAYGPTRNPWKLDHSPGGSSGGSAAAVAAGVVPLAHGNDGGGSIRIPASACGLVGLKATRGRVSTGPSRGEHRGGFAVDGMLTLSVRDTALALDVIGRPWPGEPIPAPPAPSSWVPAAQQIPPTCRIGVSVRRAHPECVRAVEDAARLLDDLGHHVEDAAPVGWYDPELTDRTIVIRTVGMAAELDEWAAAIGRPLTEHDVEASNWWSAELGRTLTGTMYTESQSWLGQWARTVAQFWTDHDILLTPTLGAPPPRIGHLSDPVDGPGRLRELIGFVDQANVSGQPAISLPTHLTEDGLPVGVQLIARHGREDLLLQVAAQIEAAHGFVPLPDLPAAT